ncbi:MAG TPA: bifunctional precorrin-2 dehydrogenase/sirohydrochlorin ferrochelatase [Isosphaeraceae bacterium]|jgi:siroheme synthase-like protein
MPGYPIELDLRGRRVLVVGLGRVGTRKASGLVEAGAHVVGVDPRPHVAIPGVEHRPEAFRPGHLDGMSLAFAAATPEVNREVVELAKRLGIWVNAASDPEQGDFLVPASWRQGLVTLAVSTSGGSPALAATLRDRAATALTNAPILADLLAEIRPTVLERIADPEARRRLLSDWGGGRWLDVLDREGPEAVRAALRASLDGMGPVS